MRSNNFFKILIAIMLVVFLIFLLKKRDGSDLDYDEIRASLNEIDTDSLSKYYQLFKISNINEEISKEDFLDFINDKNVELSRQLKNEKIKLNSHSVAKREKSFEGFYHIGVDNVDDRMQKILINNEKNSAKGDIMIPLKNYYDITPNNIYAIKKHELIKVKTFKVNKVLATSLNCSGKVKMKLDTIDYYTNSLKFNNKSFINDEDKEIDSLTLNILLQSSELKSVVEQYKYVYVPIEYKPISYFYCE